MPFPLPPEVEPIREAVWAAYWGPKREIDPHAFFKLMVDFIAYDIQALLFAADDERNAVAGLCEPKRYASFNELSLNGWQTPPEAGAERDALTSRLENGVGTPDFDMALNQAIDWNARQVSSYLAFVRENAGISELFKDAPEALERAVATAVKYDIWLNFASFAYPLIFSHRKAAHD